jgi:hypothetical protein
MMNDCNTLLANPALTGGAGQTPVSSSIDLKKLERHCWRYRARDIRRG